MALMSFEKTKVVESRYYKMRAGMVALVLRVHLHLHLARNLELSRPIFY
jgi:hypothetical protein